MGSSSLDEHTVTVPDKASAGGHPGDEASPDAPQTGENVCRTCGGTGRVGDKPCPDCGATGKVIETVGDA
ncbi:MAG TPA: hypothetical protein VFY87_23670 [Geminicoccaceae bacterium]|jgi:DnaJ-class molecular chaperone|nr:hypothetical protein [Geminicoccaceae bacterium]